MYRRVLLVSALVLACAVSAAATASPAAGPTLNFKLFIDTNLQLSQVLWAGDKFVYVSEYVGALKTSAADGTNLEPLATFPIRGVEMRCAPSPGAPSWPAGLYCHTPDNRILHVSPDGSSTSLLAKLPPSAGPESDGGIAFDDVGTFDHRLLVSSGSPTGNVNGGKIYAIGRFGKVTLIGKYPGPGGADNITIAPPHFGRAAGMLLIAIDQQGIDGRVLAMNNKGTISLVARHLGNGVNPIQVIRPAPTTRPPGSAAAGLYFGDDDHGNVYFAPAGPLKPYIGDVIVGAEIHAWFWILRPSPTHGGFQALRVQTNLPSKKWGLEGATYVP